MTGGLLGLPAHIVVALLGAVVLILHPQPTPQTPTFLQNALIAGLLSGCVHGSRYAGIYSIDLKPGTGSYVARILLGYLVVLLGRGVLKTVIHKLFSMIGIDAKAGAGKVPKDKKQVV